MKLALLVASCAVAVVACGGFEEIALNPQGAGAPGSGGSAGVSVTSPSGGGGSTSSAGSGATPGGGGPSAGRGGGGGQPIMMPSDGGTNPVDCADDDSCPSASPYCRADGNCVVCLNDSHCTVEETQCELVTGSCIDLGCPGGSANAGGNCSGM